MLKAVCAISEPPGLEILKTAYLKIREKRKDKMEENGFEYRPFQKEIYVIPVILILQIMNLPLGVRLLLAGNGLEATYIIILNVIAGIFAYFMYRWSRIRVCGKLDGICVIDHRSEEQFIPWEKIPYGYYSYNSKNQRMIVLTDTQLQKKNFKTNSSHKIVRGNSVVLYRGFGRADGVEEYLEQHVQFQNRPDWKF